MTKISNFGKQNSTLGSVVPLAMFLFNSGKDRKDINSIKTLDYVSSDE